MALVAIRIFERKATQRTHCVNSSRRVAQSCVMKNADDRYRRPFYNAGQDCRLPATDPVKSLDTFRCYTTMATTTVLLIFLLRKLPLFIPCVLLEKVSHTKSK